MSVPLAFDWVPLALAAAVSLLAGGAVAFLAWALTGSRR